LWLQNQPDSIFPHTFSDDQLVLLFSRKIGMRAKNIVSLILSFEKTFLNWAQTLF